MLFYSRLSLCLTFVRTGLVVRSTNSRCSASLAQHSHDTGLDVAAIGATEIDSPWLLAASDSILITQECEETRCPAKHNRGQDREIIRVSYAESWLRDLRALFLYCTSYGTVTVPPPCPLPTSTTSTHTAGPPIPHTAPSTRGCPLQLSVSHTTG